MLTRRSAVCALGAAALLPSMAYAQSAPGAPWNAPRRPARTPPLDAMIRTAEGERSLGDLLAGRPGVINLWATWCPPCIREKPALNTLAERLAADGDRAALLVILAYDRSVRDFDELDKALRRHHGEALTHLIATPAAERAFTAYFGAGSRPTRPAMPSSALLSADGTELGWMDGAPVASGGEASYWSQPAAFDLLTGLVG